MKITDTFGDHGIGGMTTDLLLIVVGCFLFWLIAYVLIIRRGIVDKTCGMPLPALCANLAWEILYTFVYKGDYALIRWGNVFWVGIDCCILYTAFRYAQRHQAEYVRKFFILLMLGGIALGISVMVGFTISFKDVHGIYIGWPVALLMAILFIVMVLERKKLEGQSIYIGIAIFLGNFFAFLWTYKFPDVHVDIKQINPAVLGAAIPTLILNAVYPILVYRAAKRDGINPWKRF